jgi:hypothetical protein
MKEENDFLKKYPEFKHRLFCRKCPNGDCLHELDSISIDELEEVLDELFIRKSEVKEKLLIIDDWAHKYIKKDKVREAINKLYPEKRSILRLLKKRLGLEQKAQTNRRFGGRMNLKEFKTWCAWSSVNTLHNVNGEVDKIYNEIKQQAKQDLWDDYIKWKKRATTQKCVPDIISFKKKHKLK